MAEPIQIRHRFRQGAYIKVRKQRARKLRIIRQRLTGQLQEWATGALQRLLADNAAAQKEWMLVCNALPSTMTPSVSGSRAEEAQAPSTPSRRTKAA